MTREKSNKLEIITRMRALVYADYALKFLQTRDSTTKEEREYN